MKVLYPSWVAHLNIPSIENVPNTPTTASYNLITNILKNKLEFEGLIFTDGSEH